MFYIFGQNIDTLLNNQILTINFNQANLVQRTGKLILAKNFKPYKPVLNMVTSI